MGVPVATAPPAAQNKMAGIYQYITKMDGTPEQVAQAQAQLAQLTPTTLAVYKALNLLPAGQLKSWLTANPVQFWKKVVQLFTGRKYNSGEYVLAERLNDQIYCNGNIDRQQASDDMVPIAKNIMTQLFGVRISTSDDLDALDAGVSAYKARPVAAGLSNAAINRAVYLKQNFFPISTYNNTCWNLGYFEKYPLVDKIPDPEIGKWYTGEIIGGSKAVNGMITVEANSILQQYVGATFNPVTGEVTVPGMSTFSMGSISKYAPWIAALLVLGVIISLRLGLYKPK